MIYFRMTSSEVQCHLHAEYYIRSQFYEDTLRKEQWSEFIITTLF